MLVVLIVLRVPMEVHAEGVFYTEKYEALAEETKVNRWGITLTSEEVDLLAKIVMLEAGGESVEGQEAVVEVIFNRMVDECFQGSLEEVLSKKGQFSTWTSRNKAEPTDEVYTSIDSVLRGYSDILPYETVYFRAKRCGNYKSSKQQCTIGGHYFGNK